MRHRASSRFWRCYQALPAEVRRQADAFYVLLRADPSHPFLQFKAVGRLRSVRVDLHYRALGVVAGSDVVWFWIGTHAEYDHLVAGR